MASLPDLWGDSMDIILWVLNPGVLVAHILGGKKCLFEEASLCTLQGEDSGSPSWALLQTLLLL